MIFGERLKQIRKEKNMTQVEVAKAVGIAKQTINSYEKGIKFPSLPVLTEIANCLDCSADYLLGRVESPC